jgi:hypothetical protein
MSQFNWRQLLRTAPTLGSIYEEPIQVRKRKKKRHMADPMVEDDHFDTIAAAEAIANLGAVEDVPKNLIYPLAEGEAEIYSDGDISLVDEDEMGNQKLLQCRNYLLGSTKATFLTKGSKLLVHLLNFSLKQPLCPGSDLNYEALYRALALIRYVHSEDLSDTILASIVGIIAAALPPSNAEIDNTLQDNLGAKPSVYRAVGPLNVPLYQLGQSGETACAQIDICSNGCVAFCGSHAENLSCHVCRHARYRACSSCNKATNCHCKVKRRPFEVMFFLPIKFRIEQLIHSPLRPLLYYKNTRWTPPQQTRHQFWYTDVYDGSTWQWFEDQMGENERFIGLALCSDGFDIYNMSGKCTNPVQVSILNLPPNMRNKMHVGLFLWAIDKGTDAALSVIVDELLDLWTTGIPVDNLVYRVGLVCVVLDGKGYEKVRKQQGGGSYSGCTDCDMGGVRFDGAMNISGYRRYVNNTEYIQNRYRIYVKNRIGTEFMYSTE